MQIIFANIVLGYFKEVYKQEQVPEGQILEILYLRGEINRRIGNIEKANELFDHVLELAQDLPDQSKIASLAYQQKTDPQEIL